jgi:hypothetical protein
MTDTVGPQMSNIDVLEGDGPVVWRKNPGDQIEESRLTCSIGSDQACNRSIRHFKIDLMES